MSFTIYGGDKLMKQIFENTKINICLFISDSIIKTISESVTYAQKVENAMGVTSSNLTKKAFGDINLSL